MSTTSLSTPAGHQFLLTFKRRGPYGRCVWLCTSADFTTWSEPQLVFHADDADQLLGQEHIRDRLADQTLLPRYADEPAAYNVDVYNMGAFAYEGLYIGTPAMFHAVAPTPDGRNRVGFHHVQLACRSQPQALAAVGPASTLHWTQPHRIGRLRSDPDHRTFDAAGERR